MHTYSFIKVFQPYGHIFPIYTLICLWLTDVITIISRSKCPRKSSQVSVVTRVLIALTSIWDTIIIVIYIVIIPLT